MKNFKNLDSINIESDGVFYIYPGGIMGKVLGKMVEFAEGIGDYAEFSQTDSIKSKNNIESICQKTAQVACLEPKIKEVKIIDDANSEICLEKFKEELLKSRAIVHLADNKLAGENTKTCDILSAKLNVLGIANERESIEIYGKICAKKLEKILAKREWSNAIGIELSGVGGDKHNGFLTQNLQKICKDLKIIYFCNFIESYNRIKAKIAENAELAANCLVLCVPADYTFLFENLKFIIKTSYKDKGAAPVVYLGHSLNDWSRSKIENLEKMCDYLCIGIKGFEPILQNNYELFENTKLAKTATTRGFEIIKSGYLGFEAPLKEIESLKNRVNTIQITAHATERERERERERESKTAWYDLDNFHQADISCQTKQFICHSERSEESNLIESKNTDLIKSSIDSSLRASHSAQNDKTSASREVSLKTSASREVSLKKMADTAIAPSNANQRSKIKEKYKIDSIESKTKQKRDCVLFLPYDENESIEFLNLAKSAVNAGFKAIYRSREIYPIWRNNEKIAEIFENLQKEPNFILDRGAAIAPSSYLDSFCAVCYKTTSRYTFPLLALAPSICFNPYPHALPSAFGLQFTEILKEKEFIEILKKLHKEQDLWAQNLKDFREKNAYNFGHSSEFLAEFLKKKFEL